MCLLFVCAAMAQTPAPVPTPATTSPEPTRTPTAAELMKAAIEKQHAAVAAQVGATRKQAEAAGAKMIPWAADPVLGKAEASCDPIAPDVVTPLIEDASKKNSLELKLVRAVIEQESGFRPCAISAKGAQGLMQLMPDTAEELNVKDPFDARENIGAGTKYLKQLLDRYKGQTKLALAAYNAGSAAVDAANGIPDIPETRDYVAAILKKIQ